MPKIMAKFQRDQCKCRWGGLKLVTFDEKRAITRQVALLWQRDRATRLSVEILQVQNIPIVWHYLRDPIRLADFTQYRSVTDTHTHTHTHTQTHTQTHRQTTTAYTALSIASHGNKIESVQRKFTKKLKGCKYLDYPTRLSFYRATPC